MTRRRSTSPGGAIAAILILVLLIAALIKILPYLLVGAVVAIVAVYGIKSLRESKARRTTIASMESRKNALQMKYADPEIVERLLRGSVWIGQTVEQVQDALGAPAAVDRKCSKEVTREIWKYGRLGRNQYAVRLTIERGQVVGWDSKG